MPLLLCCFTSYLKFIKHLKKFGCSFGTESIPCIFLHSLLKSTVISSFLPQVVASKTEFPL